MNQKRDNIVNEGPSIRGHAISHIDALSVLEVDGVAISFSPTEYRLVMRMLQQVEKLQNTSYEQIDFYVSFDGLLEAGRLANKSTLAKHVYNASAKLWMAGLSIARVDGYGYSIVFDAEGDANRFLRQSVIRQSRGDSTREQPLFALA